MARLLGPRGLVSENLPIFWDFHLITTICRLLEREWSEERKISSEQQSCGGKCLVDVGGQRRMGGLVRDGAVKKPTAVNKS